MASLPQLFRNSFRVPRKKSHSCRHYYIKDNSGWFPFFILIMVCCVYFLENCHNEAIPMRTQHPFMLKKIEKISLFCHLTWHYDLLSLAHTTPVLNIFSWFLCCVYLLESPQWGHSNENTQQYLHVKENRKNIPILPPDLALWFTLISSNYPCLEHIFMIPKVFEPLKFYCTLTPHCSTSFWRRNKFCVFLFVSMDDKALQRVQILSLKTPLRDRTHCP